MIELVMTMQVQKEVKRFFTCVNGCGHKFYIEHFFEDLERDPKRQFCTGGSWYCDVCGQPHHVKLERDGKLTVTKLTGPKKLDTWVELEIPPQPFPIKLRVKGMTFGDLSKSNSEYFYNEHTCPTNYFRDVVLIEVHGDQDPHGIARFVSEQLVKGCETICESCGSDMSNDNKVCHMCGPKKSGGG